MAFDYDYTGNIALLDLPKVAFFASREVSPEQRRSALRWAEQTIRTGDAVISGFHSPLEAEILERLLAARHPVIWAHAHTLHRHYPPHVEQALAEGRILIFAARNIPRAGLRAAQARNCIVASMAARSLFVINASAGRHRLPRRHIRHGTHVGTGNTAAIGPPHLSKNISVTAAISLKTTIRMN
ncbi:MAG: hypothetical protein L6V80_02180 [Bacteroidales bacterium]|nr:MAG: hypothetical protein L6V80_02180 [Bacteroidales bacterium]